jgi:virginiamycin B lyase
MSNSVRRFTLRMVMGVSAAVMVVAGTSVVAGMAGAAKPKPRPLVRITAEGGGGLVVGDGAVWAADSLDGEVLRVDPRRRRVVASVRVGAFANELFVAFGAGSVWVSNENDNAVYRVDPATNQVAARVPVGSFPWDLEVGDGAVWVANHHGGSVSRIDPTTNTVVATIRVGGDALQGPAHVAVAPGAVWVSIDSSRELVRIDPATNEIVARVSVPAGVCGGLAASTTSVWSGGRICGDGVTLVDPATNTVARHRRLPGMTFGLEYAHGALWSANGSRLLRLDPISLAVRKTVATHTPVAFIASGAGAIWARTPDAVLRVRP